MVNPISSRQNDKKMGVHQIGKSPLVEPDVRISRTGSPTDAAFRHTLPALPRQLHLKLKFVLESPRLLLEEVLVLRHSPDRCLLHKHRPLSYLPAAQCAVHTGTGVTRYHGYYEPVRHPIRPSLSLAGFRLLSFSSDGGLPRSSDGSAHTLPFSKPAQRSLTFPPAYSPSRLTTLYTGGFGDVVIYVFAPFATDFSNICGWDSHPLKIRAFSTAH